jgi:hypothetical protein
MFSNQKSKFWSILEGLGMKKVGIFYGHLEYIYYGHMVFSFGHLEI